MCGTLGLYRVEIAAVQPARGPDIVDFQRLKHRLSAQTAVPDQVPFAMKSTAPVWTPGLIAQADHAPQLASNMGGASTASFFPSDTSETGAKSQLAQCPIGIQNDLIQVTRYGCSFFVRRSQAMVDPDIQNIDVHKIVLTRYYLAASDVYMIGTIRHQ
jgi:hypothetical protein